MKWSMQTLYSSQTLSTTTLLGLRVYSRVWYRFRVYFKLYFKVFFIYKYIKIMSFFLLKKIVFDVTHQNNSKIILNKK